MRWTVLIVGVLVAALILVAGCGQTPLQQAKVVGLTAKQTAETAYLTVRIEWELGHVDDAAMNKARSLYARFEMAQKAYVAAIELWESGAPEPDLQTLRQDVTVLAAALHALALDVKAEPPPATTQPAGKEVARV